jgi:dCTP diphosphatase
MLGVYRVGSIWEAIRGMPDFTDLLDRIQQFRDERNWKQFHSPKNLAAAISIEVGELQETMLWKLDEEVQQLLAQKEKKQEISDEIADVLILSLLFCDSANIDPLEAIEKKLAKNAAKYPVELAKNRSDKYTELK